MEANQAQIKIISDRQ